MTDAHTPTPWKLGEVRAPAGIKWDQIIRSVAKNDPVCSVGFAGYTAKEAAANAAHIVKCVNTHPLLVEALREIIDAMDAPLGANAEGGRAVYNAVDKARAALSAVEDRT